MDPRRQERRAKHHMRKYRTGYMDSIGGGMRETSGGVSDEPSRSIGGLERERYMKTALKKEVQMATNAREL